MWFDTKSQPYSKCILRMHTLKIIAYVKLTDEIMDMNVGGNETQRKTKQLAKGTVFSGFVLIKTYSVRCYRLIRIYAKQNQTKPNQTKRNHTELTKCDEENNAGLFKAHISFMAKPL